MSTTIAARRPRSRRGAGGQLRGEILAAASALVATANAPGDVSVRAIADSVGVSVMSIYHHFADKQALLDAVVADEFAELDAAITAAAVGIDDPLDALIAQAQAYVTFALDRPGFYRCATAVLADAASRTFAAGVTACTESGIFPPVDARAVSAELWTAAHGAATALITHPALAGGDHTDFSRRVLRASVLGRSLGQAE